MTKSKSTQERDQARALEALADLGGRRTTEDDISFEGKRLIVPETMKSLNEVQSFLSQRIQDEEQHYTFNRTLPYRPEDGAVATARAIRKAFGMSVGRPLVTFFGTNPPELRDVQVSLTETEQAPFGHVELPGLDGMLIYIGAQRDAVQGSVFWLQAEGPRKHRHVVAGFFKLVEEELRTDSIYRGKAIDGSAKPNFLDLSGVDPASVFYSEDVLTQLSANVWTPISHADLLAQRRHSGKRAVLFEGPYGTGKTLAAYLTAQRAVEAGWTFLLVRPGRDDLMQALQTARMYQPAVVFTEDIDTLGSADSGGPDHIAQVLDLFDGIEAKGLRMLLVLTTNSVDKLHPALLRPGRLDAVISVRDLDQTGVENLTRYVLADRLSDDVSWDKVHAAVEGYTPAFVREVINRTDVYALVRGEVDYKVTTDDLVHAAEGLRPQWDLMRAAKAEATPNALVQGLSQVVAQAARDGLTGVEIKDRDGDKAGDYGMFIGGRTSNNR